MARNSSDYIFKFGKILLTSQFFHTVILFIDDVGKLVLAEVATAVLAVALDIKAYAALSTWMFSVNFAITLCVANTLLVLTSFTLSHFVIYVNLFVACSHFLHSDRLFICFVYGIPIINGSHDLLLNTSHIHGDQCCMLICGNTLLLNPLTLFQYDLSPC